MSKKTITKFSVFVILLTLAVGLTSCSGARSNNKTVSNAQISGDYEKPRVAGNIKSPDVTESSGLAFSKCQPDVLWTHNDAGDDAFLFALSANGDHLGTWKIPNAKNIDWEDMAAFKTVLKDGSGLCFLYIGEIGNNKEQREQQRVYRIVEPKIAPSDAGSSKQNPLTTAAADVLNFKFPDRPHDSETLLVHPKTGEIYVLTKTTKGPSLVFKIRPDFGSAEIITPSKIADLSVPSIPTGLLTGGSISPDGTRIVLCDYSNAYELRLPSGSAAFDEIWKQKPLVVDLGDRKQGEAVTYNSDGTAIYASSEKKTAPIIVVERKK